MYEKNLCIYLDLVMLLLFALIILFHLFAYYWTVWPCFWIMDKNLYALEQKPIVFWYFAKAKTWSYICDFHMYMCDEEAFSKNLKSY